MTEAGETTPPGGRRPRRVRRFATIAAASALLVVSLFAVRLAVGPISLPTADRLVYGLLGDLAGPRGRVAVGSVALAWEGERGFAIVVRDLAITGPAGVLEAPRTSVDVSVLALLGGRIVGRDLLVDAPTVDLAPFATMGAGGDGDGEAGSAGASGTPGPVAALERAERRLARLVEVAGDYAFERFRLRDGTILFPGADPDLPRPRLDGVVVTVEVGAEGDVAGTARGRSASGPWRVSFERTAGPEGTRIRGEGTDVAVLDVLPAAGPLRTGFALAPALAAEFAPDGSARRVDVALGIGPGRMKFGRDPVRSVDRIDLSLAWSAADGVFDVREAALVAGPTRVRLSGAIVPPTARERAATAAPGTWRYRLAAKEARLSPPDVPGPPLVLKRFAVAGAIDPARSTVTFDRGVAIAPLGVYKAAGSLAIGPDGPSFAGSAEIAATTVETLKRIWPPVTAHDARTWLVNEVEAGTIVRARADFALTPEDLDGLPETTFHVPGGIDVEIDFRDGVLRLPGELPALAGATGKARVLDRRAGLAVTDGRLRVDGRPDLAVSAFEAEVEDLGARPPPARMRARVAGPAETVVAIADREPVDVVEAVGISPDDVSGTVEAELALSGTFADPIDPAALEWRVDATVRDGASSAKIAGRTVSEADVVFRADPRRFGVAGSARIDGIAAEINYTEVLDGDGSGSGGAEIALDADTLAARGWDLGGRVGGRVRVGVEQTESGTEALEIDLADAELDFAELGWRKKAGAPGRLTAVVERSAEGIRLEDVVLRAGEADIRGTIRLGPDGALREARLDRVRLSPADSLSAAVTPTDGGGYAVSVRGERFDARRVFATEAGLGTGSPEGSGGGPPIRLEAAIDGVLGADGLVLEDLAVDGAARGGRLVELDLAGRLVGRDGPSEVTVGLTPVGPQVRKLNARSADVGALLRFIGVYDRVRGGTGALDAAIRPSGEMDGALTIEDFGIDDEPTLEEIIARSADRIAEIGGDDPRPLAFQRGGDRAERPGTRFERLSIEFVRRGSAVRLTDAVLSGPVVGGTAEGLVDFAAGTIDIDGTFIPAYAFNNLFGRVPMLGGILGGGSRGGLIGVTFQLAGRMEEPSLVVNPVSAVAPGILRKVFEFN